MSHYVCSKENLRWGIIGCGRAGMAHARQINGLPHVFDLVFAADINKERALKISPKAYQNEIDSIRLLTESCIEGITICTPPENHLETLISLIEKGIPVFCEKPLLGNLPDLKKIQL